MSDSSLNKPHKSFGIIDFMWRTIVAIILVLLTFNPGGYSYFHWVKDAMAGDGVHALHFFLGVVLLIGWTIFVIATSRSLGTFGSILGAALNATSRPWAPWYATPADNKPYMRLQVAEILAESLRSLKLQYPQVSQKQFDKNEEMRKLIKKS